ncbi:MAG: hypothetical protein NTW18_01515 [Candidatus Omnitrophica bacterium]|nr:hypothetical protein [Candidatus Omnitrophota bacterium]
MRDLLFKNLVSDDHRRKIIASCEVMDKQGVRSTIRRHFICMIKEIKDENNIEKPLPYLYILKEHNTKEQKEKFFCKIKGSVCAISNGKLFLIVFMHSLKIDLIARAEQVV